jgi:hypothetical protein
MLLDIERWLNWVVRDAQGYVLGPHWNMTKWQNPKG